MFIFFKDTRFTESMRFLSALLIVFIFLFPIIWWAITSLKPLYATINLEKVIFFDFKPTFQNYFYALRKSSHSFVSSFSIALASSFLTLLISLITAFCLSRMLKLSRKALTYFIMIFLMIPPIALIIPVTSMIREFGIHDTHLAVILLNTFLNFPIATLVLLIFMNKVSFTLDETAALDGASRYQFFIKILLPLMRVGNYFVLIICFFLSYTEFLLSIFLTNSIQTIPIKITHFGSQTFGLTSAFGTTSLILCLICIFVFNLFFDLKKNNQHTF